MSLTDRQMRKTMGKWANLKGGFGTAFAPTKKWKQGNDMSDLRVGSYVHVDFISESCTQFSGVNFKGNGAIDRIEDGYVFGRLDDGQPFCCMAEFVKPLQDQTKPNSQDGAFVAWLKTTPEYKTLIFIHGERLFLRRHNGFDVLAVQLAYKAWQQSKVNIESLQNENDILLSQKNSLRVLCETACELLNEYAHQDAMVILDDMEDVLRSDDVPQQGQEA